MSFFIDASEEDKLNFKMTLLLSISVFLLILNDTLPSTAEKIPLIGESSAESENLVKSVKTLRVM